MNHLATTSITTRLTRLLLVLGVLCGTFTSLQPSAQAQAPAAPAAASTTVYVPLAMNSPVYNSPFGVQVDEPHGSLTDQALNGAVSLGTGWARISAIRWRELQPTENGPIQWNSDIDNIFRRLASAGIKTEAMVFDFPAWATTQKQNCSPIKPAKYQAFARFMQQVINRYKTAEFNVHNWELGNEIDIDPRFYQENQISLLGCWGNIDDTQFYGGQAYGTMLKEVVPSLRAADTDIKIWHGGLLLDKPNTTQANRGKPERFLNGVLDAGGGPYFDVLAIHAYTYYTGSRTDYDADPANAWTGVAGGNSITVGKVRYVKSILQAYNQEAKPIFINEVALLCIESDFEHCGKPYDRLDPQFYDMQSTFLVRSYTRALGEGVAGVTWFCITGPWRHSFLLDGQGPTATFDAYKQLATQLRYGTFAGNPNYGSAVEAWAFAKGGGVQTHVIWSRADNTTFINVPQSQFVSAVAMDGSELAKNVLGSDYQIMATFEPIYVTVRIP